MMVRKSNPGVRFRVPVCRRMRHWFTYHGEVGSVAPVCRWCGVPNPYLSDDEIARLNGREREEYRKALLLYCPAGWSVPAAVLAVMTEGPGDGS